MFGRVDGWMDWIDERVFGRLMKLTLKSDVVFWRVYGLMDLWWGIYLFSRLMMRFDDRTIKGLHFDRSIRIPPSFQTDTQPPTRPPSLQTDTQPPPPTHTRTRTHLLSALPLEEVGLALHQVHHALVLPLQPDRHLHVQGCMGDGYGWVSTWVGVCVDGWMGRSINGWVG